MINILFFVIGIRDVTQIAITYFRRTSLQYVYNIYFLFIAIFFKHFYNTYIPIFIEDKYSVQIRWSPRGETIVITYSRRGPNKIIFFRHLMLWLNFALIWIIHIKFKKKMVFVRPSSWICYDNGFSTWRRVLEFRKECPHLVSSGIEPITPEYHTRALATLLPNHSYNGHNIIIKIINVLSKLLVVKIWNFLRILNT